MAPRLPQHRQGQCRACPLVRTRAVDGGWSGRDWGLMKRIFFVSMTYGCHTDSATMSPKNGSNTVLELKMI